MRSIERTIRILLVEDEEADAELALLALQAHGLAFEYERVSDERAFLAALERMPDIVLSDQRLPGFTGERALELLSERGVDIPYIAMSGELSSAEAVRLLRAGARDFVPKHDLTRLGPAVAREIAESEARRVHRREARLLDQLKLAVESSDDSIAVFDRELRFLYANPAHQRRHGQSADWFVSRHLRDVIGEVQFLRALPHLERGLEGDTVRFETEQSFAGAGLVQASITYSPLRDPAGHVIGVVGVLRDITEQHRAAQALSESEGRYRKLFDANPLPCWLYDRGTLRFLAVNEAAVEHYGWSHDEFLAMTIADIRPDEDLPRLQAAVADFGIGVHHSGLWRHRRKDGSLIDVEISSHGIEFDGHDAQIVLALDVTARLRAEQERRESLERLETVTRATSDVVWEWDCLHDRVVWNENLVAVFGHALQPLVTGAAFWLDHVHPEDRPGVEFALHASLTGTGSHWQAEYRFRHKDGHYLQVFDRGHIQRDAEGKPVRMIGAMQDITARKQAEERLVRLAEYDALTDLPNRNALDATLHAAMQAGGTPPGEAALFVVNLDRFKEINDTLGHGAGDAALIRAAGMLRELAPAPASVARLGGDEFAVVVPACGHGCAEALAERIIDAFSRPMLAGGHEIFITASVGIALAPLHGAEPELLLRNADLAMYRAKSEHPGGYLFYDARFTARLRNLRQLETDLHRALERGELSLRFQPLLALEDRSVVGAEALLRWTHPELGDVSPARFIPVAEETGLIVPIGEWVLREACRQAVAWQAAGHPEVRIAVNVSAHQLRRGGFADLVAGVLKDSGLPARLLELELTESSLMQDTAAASAVLHELKALGVQIAMDDFGTGYSSLAYLRRFPIDKLKIDRSFVAELPADPEAAALAGTIIAMAHGLGMTALAEGIETPEQARFLRDLGCEEGQGWLFAKAMPADELLRLLDSGPINTGGWRRPATSVASLPT